jgi:tetratricopeptide (TPR) repeat protein
MMTGFRIYILSLFTFMILSASFSTPCLANAQDVYQNVDEMLAQGKNQQAFEILQALPNDNGNRAETLWRMARAQYEMGRLVETDDKEDDRALVYYQEAEKYARETIAEAPGKSEGYKWLAITLGVKMKYGDIKSQVQEAWEIKKNIDKAIALAPDDDIAYLVLSRWHYKISELGFWARSLASMLYGELPKASLEESEELLKKAISIHDRISHRYNLARVYDRMERRADAKLQYEKALLLPVTFPEEAKEQEKARSRLQRRKW